MLINVNIYLVQENLISIVTTKKNFSLVIFIFYQCFKGQSIPDTPAYFNNFLSGHVEASVWVIFCKQIWIIWMPSVLNMLKNGPDRRTSFLCNQLNSTYENRPWYHVHTPCLLSFPFTGPLLNKTAGWRKSEPCTRLQNSTRKPMV